MKFLLKKLFIISLGAFMLMGVSRCPTEKYMAPKFEDCIILTEWDAEKKVDKATIMCYDERITNDTYDVFSTRVLEAYNEHPLRSDVVKYLEMNRDRIIVEHEYELPISYGRGYRATSNKDAEMITKWAEDNRMGRIKCEYSLDNK